MNAPPLGWLGIVRLGLVQSAWAIGYGLAALVTMIVLPRWGWRAVFFVGVLPALLTFWIRRAVPEPRAWTEAQRDDAPRLPLARCSLAAAHSPARL